MSQEDAPASRGEEAIKAEPPAEPQVPVTANGDATADIVEKKKKVSRETALQSKH